MARIHTLLTAALLTLFFLARTHAQTADPLPRSLPEAEGVSSENIAQFIDAAGAGKHEMHSVMVLRHGKVVAEAWWNPYRPDLRHTMYSVSKSFTATAIGFAVSENRLSVEDKVISFFSGDLPAEISPNLAELRVRDLLSMSAGQFPEPSFTIAGRDSNWVRSFLATPIVHKPGTKFLYNSLCTYMLSAIVTKVTGEKLLDYLRPRLFEPLGIEGADWESDPMGINVGGWGLRIKTEDMAKFGQLFLQKGVWKGRQILPRAWVEEASALKIIQNPDLPQEKKDASDWEQGYCYQMWRCRNNAYRGDGAFGQYIIVLPDQDAVVAITSETSDMQDELNLVWKYLLPSFKKEPLPANKNALKTLRQKTAALALPLHAKSPLHAIAQNISGKTYFLSPNAQFVRSMAFRMEGERCQVGMRIGSDSFQLVFGAGHWAMSETAKLGPSLVLGAKGHFAGLPPSKTAGNYRWKDDRTLELVLRYIESPHTETITCRFEGDRVSVDFQSSFNKANPQTFSGIAGRRQAVRLIVRGDDMGFSHAANEALVQCFRDGIESSIEVIVPSPWFPEAVKMLAQNPGIDVGVHLAITSEWENVKWRPLSDCPSIRDADGYFYPMVYANKNYPGQSILENNWKIEDIEKEFRAQIEMALKKIPRISHVSAHMGCSGISPEVKAMTRKLAQAYHIDINLEEHGVRGMGYDGPKATAADKIGSFIRALQKLEPGQTYLFVDHPARDVAELQAVFHIGYEDVAADRQGVTELFTSPEVRNFIRKNGIQLIGYKDFR